MTSRPDPSVCRNCGEPLTGPYCAQCGQEDVPDLPFGRILRDAVGEILNLDARVWRTWRLLFTRPGLLSAEYRQGRRRRYTSPVRLYLVSSVIMFTMVLAAPVHLVYLAPPPVPMEQTDGEGVQSETGPSGGWIEARLARAAGDVDRFNRLFVRSLAWSMFLLIPVFALLLKLGFFGSGTLYWHHLVFAFHFHAFGFLTLGAAYAAAHLDWEIRGVSGPHLVLLAPHLVNAAYLYLAARRFYGTGPLPTLGGLAVTGVGYPVAIVTVSALAVGGILFLF